MVSLLSLADLYVVCGVALLLERRRLVSFGHRVYVTPVFAFVGSVAIVYLFPATAAAEGYRSIQFLPGRLSDDDLRTLIASLRIFLYSFIIVFVLLLPTLEGRAREQFSRAVPAPSTVKRIAAIVIVIWIVHLVVGVGLSPASLISRALHPREYTDLRSGTGGLVYLRAAAFLVAFVITGLRLVQARQSGKSAKGPALVFLAFIVLDVLGGSKQSVIVGPLVVMYIWGAQTTANRTTKTPSTRSDRMAASWRQRRHIKPAKQGYAILRYAASAVTVLLLLWLAFGVMQTAQQKATGQTVADHIISYEPEAYYSARVIEDYPPNATYALTGLEDAIRGAVPRSLFPDKAPVGFFGRYWRERYTPNVVSYQATTFGVLAEAHMMFGNWGIAGYGAGFALLMAFMYRLQYSRGSWLSLAVGAFFVQWMYFIVRGGIVGSALLYIVVELALILIMVKLCGAREEEQRSDSDGVGSATLTPKPGATVGTSTTRRSRGSGERKDCGSRKAAAANVSVRPPY